MSETLEIARDVARRLIEAQDERQQEPTMPPPVESADLTLVVGA